MKYLFYENESDTKAKVVLIYYETPPKELTDRGNYIEVDVVPNPEQREGKTALLYCNPETREFWYEYIDRPLTAEEIANQKLAEQQSQIDELTLLLGDVLIGGAM